MTTESMFQPWETKPDMCELHRCDNPYVEGTGDIDEGHWVCGRDDCEANRISTDSEESIAMSSQMFPVSSDSDREWFWTELAELNADAVTFDGFGDCVVGYASQFNNLPVVVYDHELMMEQLMREDDMTYEDAYEYLSFNVEGLWAGEFTPMIMRRA